MTVEQSKTAIAKQLLPLKEESNRLASVKMARMSTVHSPQAMTLSECLREAEFKNQLLIE